MFRSLGFIFFTTICYCFLVVLLLEILFWNIFFETRLSSSKDISAENMRYFETAFHRITQGIVENEIDSVCAGSEKLNSCWVPVGVVRIYFYIEREGSLLPEGRSLEIFKIVLRRVIAERNFDRTHYWARPLPPERVISEA